MGIYANEGECVESKVHNAVDFIVFMVFAVKFAAQNRLHARAK